MEKLLREMARELFRRPDLADSDLLTDFSAHLSAILDRLRAFDEALAQDCPPVTAFRATHAALGQPPQLDWDALAPLAGKPREVLDAGRWSGVPGETSGANNGPAGNGTLLGRGGGGAEHNAPSAPPTADPAAPRICASDDLAHRPIAELVAAMGRGELSPVDLVERTLARIDALDGRLRSFVTVLPQRARIRARELADELARGGKPRPLHGIPVAVKDLVHMAGVPTTAGSRLMADYVAREDATVIRRLQDAGAVIIGKTATHEFAFGMTTDSPLHGPVFNPWDPARIVGGSSGGSAAAVAARLVRAALGTDTGASVRLPAAACGTVGLKPTYGRVSKHGVVPASWSLDHVGVLAASVAEAALLLQVLAGSDPLDPSTLDDPVSDYMEAVTAPSLRGLRLAVPRNWVGQRVDQEVAACFQQALATLAQWGAHVDEIDFLPLEPCSLLFRLIVRAEGAAFHAPLLEKQGADYDPRVRIALELGHFISARDYLLAQRLRGELIRLAHRALGSYRALIVPTMAVPTPLVGQERWRWPDGEEPVSEAVSRFLSPANLLGFPAAAIPWRMTTAGIPASVQVIARPLDEGIVLRVGAVLELAANARPPGR